MNVFEELIGNNLKGNLLSFFQVLVIIFLPIIAYFERLVQTYEKV
jgi:hypothetical protein